MKKQVGKIEFAFDWQTSVNEFLEWKKLQDVSEYAITDHRSAWSLFLRENQVLDLRDTKLVRRKIQGFLRDKKASYYNKQLQAFRQFFDYLIEEGEMSGENPCKGIKYKNTPVRIVDHDKEVIRALLRQPDKTTYCGYRDYVFMVLILDTGIRPHEALQLRVADIDGKGVSVAEKVSKTRVPRYLPISATTAQVIKKLLSVRHNSWDVNGPILSSHSGQLLHTHDMQQRFRCYAQAIGADITPYHLRHVFALTFIRNGGDVFALQKIMGHSKLDMTRHYVNLVQTDIVKSHAKAGTLMTFLQDNHRVRKLVK